jgi:NAD(P)-dependent dehydrogenase (short-subunit alcohol dehydrogenase family)
VNVDLTGRTALVTGSSAGIGNAIAAGLLEAGARVVINAPTSAEVAEGVRRLGGGEHLDGVAADASSAAGCAALIAAAPDVDILINNVGGTRVQPLFEIADEEWERLFALNVMSGVRLSRHHLPRMARRGWGRAVFLSSEAGLHIPPHMVHYGTTKAAVIAVARGFAEAVARTGVTVNTVLPGPTFSATADAVLDELAQAGAESREAAGRRMIADEYPTSLLGRFTRPEEIASLVVYLASDHATATTGAVMRADGGIVRAIP